MQSRRNYAASSSSLFAVRLLQQSELRAVLAAVRLCSLLRVSSGFAPSALFQDEYINSSLFKKDRFSLTRAVEFATATCLQDKIRTISHGCEGYKWLFPPTNACIFQTAQSSTCTVNSFFATTHPKSSPMTYQKVLNPLRLLAKLRLSAPTFIALPFFRAPQNSAHIGAPKFTQSRDMKSERYTPPHWHGTRKEQKKDCCP